MKNIINNLSVFISGDIKNIPIVFVHGFPFDHYMWEEQIKEFSGNYYCITYDIRGLGESPAGDGQLTIESLVDDLEKILNELRLDRPVLCGFSMGGYISLRASERIAEKFRALILCDTKSLADDNEGKIKRAAGVRLINDDGVDNFVNQFVPNCFSETFMVEHKSEFEKVLSRSRLSNPDGVKGCLLAMAGRTDTTNYLSMINMPVLLICGEEDKLTPPDVMQSMDDKIKNSKMIVIEGAGHIAPVERPEIINKEILKFLSGLR
jgi:pimeloyl-ACP methyl ester carboxylesterase